MAATNNNLQPGGQPPIPQKATHLGLKKPNTPILLQPPTRLPTILPFHLHTTPMLHPFLQRTITTPILSLQDPKITEKLLAQVLVVLVTLMPPVPLMSKPLLILLNYHHPYCLLLITRSFETLSTTMYLVYHFAMLLLVYSQRN